MNLLQLILLTAIVILGGAAFSCPKKSNPADGVFHGINPDSDKEKATSTKGVELQSPFKIQPYMSSLGDLGLDDVFAAATLEGYSGFTLHNTYRLWLYPKSSQCQSESFITDIYSQYLDQGEYDKDRTPGKTLLCLAGTMWLHNFQPGAVVVNSPAGLRFAAYAEGEHNVLFQVDGRRFNLTALAHYHPILGTNQGRETAAREKSAEPDKHYQVMNQKALKDLESQMKGEIAKTSKTEADNFQLVCALITK